MVKRTVEKVINNPNLAARGLNRLYHTRMHTRPYNTSGVDIFQKDWDNLLILDACRYDMFNDQNTIQGNLSLVKSRGSYTVGFLDGNFDSRDLRDTVYITANPQFYRHFEEFDITIHAVHDVWLEDGWDEEDHTVPPDTLTESAKRYAKKYPNKRLIVHYIQPHYPFIGGGGRDVFENTQAFLKPDEYGSWEQIVRGQLKVSKEDVWEAYRENLDYVLPHAEELATTLKGKTVVTSDHGNMVGERSFPIPNIEWGHPAALYTEQLVNVPWLICPVADERKNITEGAAHEYHTQSNTEVATERLESLGYLE